MPGGDRTHDLGIKSPAEEAATECEKLKRPVNRAYGRCGELQRTEPCGDKRLRASLRAIVAYFDNDPGRESDRREKREKPSQRSSRCGHDAARRMDAAADVLRARGQCDKMQVGRKRAGGSIG